MPVPEFKSSTIVGPVSVDLESVERGGNDSVSSDVNGRDDLNTGNQLPVSAVPCDTSEIPAASRPDVTGLYTASKIMGETPAGDLKVIQLGADGHIITDIDVPGNDETVISEDVHYGVPSVWGGAPLTAADGALLFDNGVFGAGKSLPAAASATIYFNKPVFLDEFEVFVGQTAVQSLVIGRGWVTADGAIITDAVAESTKSLVKTKITAITLTNNSGVAVMVSYTSLKKYHHRVTFPEESTNWQDREFVVPDDVSSADVGGMDLSPEQIRKVFMGDVHAPPWITVPDHTTVRVYFRYPIWADELEIIDENGNALTDSAVHRIYATCGGVVVEETDNLSKKTLIKDKIKSLELRTGANPVAFGLISVKKYHHRTVFPEDGSNWTDRETVLTDDISVSNSSFTGQTSTETLWDNLFAKGLDGPTYSLPVGGDIYIAFKTPVWVDEVEFATGWDFLPGQHLLVTEGFVTLKYYDMQSTEFPVGEESVWRIKKKISALKFTNTSGSPVTVENIPIKRFHHRTVFPEEGTPAFTTAQRYLQSYGGVPLAGAAPTAEVGISFSPTTRKGKVKRILIYRTAKAGTAYTGNSLDVVLRSRSIAPASTARNIHTLYRTTGLEPDVADGHTVEENEVNIGEIFFRNTDPIQTDQIYVTIARAGGDGTSSESYAVLIQGEEMV